MSSKKEIDPLQLRKKLGLTQAQFWKKINVTQSGGSRYESGRKMPKPVQQLLVIAHGTPAQCSALVTQIRSH